MVGALCPSGPESALEIHWKNLHRFKPQSVSKNPKGRHGVVWHTTLKKKIKSVGFEICSSQLESKKNGGNFANRLAPGQFEIRVSPLQNTLSCRTVVPFWNVIQES